MSLLKHLFQNLQGEEKAEGENFFRVVLNSLLTTVRSQQFVADVVANFATAAAKFKLLILLLLSLNL